MKNPISKFTATYKGKKVNVVFVSQFSEYALITYEQDESKKFKVNFEELDDIEKTILKTLKKK